MSRKQADAPHELDPLKGGLKHHPFAALREKLKESDGAATPAAEGEQPKHVDDASSAVREGQHSNSVRAKREVARGVVGPTDHASGSASASARTRGSGAAVSADHKQGSSNPRERVTVRIERTGRGGKTVTIAEGPALAGLPLEALARDIARGMGTGARAKDGAIVVQGDQRDRLVTWLGERSFPGAVAGN